MQRRIAITGPESTGKSWLAEHLALEFHAGWVPEYAREHLEALDRPYLQKDIKKIAQGQLEREELKALKGDPFLFCDTEFLVTRIWSLVKYGACDPWIETMADTHRYDLYLLCDIDLPWEFDPLREHPDKRQWLFDLYLKELNRRSLPFRIVKGSGRDRLLCALEAIKSLKNG